MDQQSIIARGMFAAPVLADLDKDGKLDIIAPAFDGNVYAFPRRRHERERLPRPDPLQGQPQLGAAPGPHPDDRRGGRLQRRRHPGHPRRIERAARPGRPGGGHLPGRRARDERAERLLPRLAGDDHLVLPLPPRGLGRPELGRDRQLRRHPRRGHARQREPALDPPLRPRRAADPREPRAEPAPGAPRSEQPEPDEPRRLPGLDLRLALQGPGAEHDVPALRAALPRRRRSGRHARRRRLRRLAQARDGARGIGVVDQDDRLQPAHHLERQDGPDAPRRAGWCWRTSPSSTARRSPI